MTDYDILMEDADYLLAESCLSIYDILTEGDDTSDSVPHKPDDDKDDDSQKHNQPQQHQQNTNNDNQQHNQPQQTHTNDDDSNKHQQNTNNDNQQQSSGNNDNNKPDNSNPDLSHVPKAVKDPNKDIPFSKYDLNNPEKLKRILKKAKRTNNVKLVKTILRSTLSLGSLAATAVVGLPVVPVVASNILAQMSISMHDNKKDREMQQFIVIIDKKLNETNVQMMTEKDPEKQKALREYAASLKQTKMRIKAIRNA